MPFDHTLVSLEALTRAQDLARLMGGEEYLSAQAKEIAAALLARRTLPTHITRREASTWQRYELRKVTVAPSTQRRLDAKAREKLARDYPQAWKAAVRVTPPEHVYHARLEAQRPGKRSEEWGALKKAGAGTWMTMLGQRFGDRDWSQPGVQASTLYELREFKRGVENAIKKARIELMQFVIDRELPLIIPGYGDGKLILRENPMSYAVDYDVLEQRFPAAATLITRNSVSGSVRLAFTKFVPTPEEPDDSDDSAYSVEYRQRRGGA